jgi:hypothetical protein
MKKLLILFPVLLALGCGVTSPKRSSPQKVVAAEGQLADYKQSSTVPQLDILFVVDNSLSMERHQVNLANNINDFVNAFSKNATLDFHIGVETIWDSDPKHSPLVAAKHPLGQLIPLQDPDPNAPRGTPLMVNNQMPPRFVTRDTPNLTNVLARTIVLGDEVGPEFEEMFSPLEAFFTPQNLNGPNAGFYRPDAHLLVVFITDANDSTLDVGPEQLYDDLVAIKNNKRDLLHFYAILSPVGDNNCHKDLAGPPYKFTKLIAYSEGTILSLCSPTFGQELADFGQKLSVKVSRQVIHLDHVPDMDSPFTVTYGSQTIPQAGTDLDSGWVYEPDPNDQKVILGGKIKLNPEPGARISVNYTPIDFGGIPSGKTHVMTPQASPAPRAVVPQGPVPVQQP